MNLLSMTLVLISGCVDSEDMAQWNHDKTVKR